MKKLPVLAALLSAMGSYPCAAAGDSVTLAVVASGETHAMLVPCDCPDDPGGGLAERATVLKALGAGENLLLLDAGGFAGGGIYDHYTGGRPLDSQRTAAAMRAMGAMGYDAVAVGDDELQYGGRWIAETADAASLALVSANIVDTGGRKCFSPWRLVVKKGVRFAVTGLATRERLLRLDGSCITAPPVPSLRKIWKAMVAASDYQIILSHLGEEEAAALADSFPECDLIVNGHRKTGQQPVVRLGKTLLMQFGYEGKKLSRVSVKLSAAAGGLAAEREGWIHVAAGTVPDPAVAALLPSGGAAVQRPVFDLYIMSDCAYGREALREFMAFLAGFPGVEWNVWFIGSLQGDSLVSLHGNAEVRDEMAWCAVKALYPAAWPAFLEARGREGAATGAVIRKLGFDSAKIGRWVREKGRAVLADHYRRSLRLKVTASPSLFINNVPFDKAIDRRRLAKAACPPAAKRPLPCDSLPECFDDGDCRKKGAVGRCAETGRCVFTPDAEFTFLVLIADSTIQHPERAVIATTEELFPNASIEVVTMGCDRGRKLLRNHAPSSLPFYHFGAPVAKAKNFGRIESGLVRAAGGFTFREGITAASYFPGRPLAAPRTVLFVDPLFAGAASFVAAIAADSVLAPAVRVLPAVTPDTAAQGLTVEEKVRREEALRWLVLDTLYRSRALRYIAPAIRDAGSSYWFGGLQRAGIDLDEFVLNVRARGTLLDQHLRLLRALGVRDPVSLLLDNRQLVVIKSEADGNETLDLLRRRMKTRR